MAFHKPTQHQAEPQNPQPKNVTSSGGIAEKPKVDNVPGYPKLAQAMSSSPQMALFRRFGRLTMLNLLRLQAELQVLEKQLLDTIVEDATAQDGDIEDHIRRLYSKDFRTMRDAVDSEGDSVQHDLPSKIANKLQEYSQAFSAASVMAAAKTPAERQVDILQQWLKRTDGGADEIGMGDESLTWASANVPNLITLCPPQLETDPFTSFLAGGMLDVYHRLWGHRKKAEEGDVLGSGFRSYSVERISRASKIIASVLSATVPTITVLVLYFIKRMIVRIGLVIVFTALFSLALGVFTEAKKQDIFTATATFAAVEVVFIAKA